MFAVIHGASPVGLPNHLTTQYGNPYETYPTAEQATIMQDVALKTVCDYHRSGVDCETVGISSDINESHRINIYPVPVYQILNIESNLFKEATQFTIVDQLGKIRINGIIDSETISVDVSGISEGLYFLITKNQAIKFVK